MDDPTFYIWGTAAGYVNLSHAPCGEDLLAHQISFDVTGIAAAVAAHNCPGIVPGPEGAGGN